MPLPNCLDCNKKLTDYRCKRCKKCANTKENNPYWKGGVRKKQIVNKESHRKSCEKYNKLHPEKRKESYTNYAIRNKELISKNRNMPENKTRKRNGEIIKAYGITFNEFNQMVANQNNKCAICNLEFNNKKQTHIDHNHKTGIVRQILCHKCNVGIGLFGENIDLMKLAINYLERWS